MAQNGKQGMWITSLNSHFTPQGPQHQMLRRKKAEPKTPHFLSLNQDIVAWPQEEKCELKYVIYTFGNFLEKYSEEEANRLAVAS